MATGGRKENLFDMGAYCPFWRGTRNHTTICCEGPYTRSSVCVTFSTRRAFDLHRRTYCYGKGCESCRIYESVIKQYEEDT